MGTAAELIELTEASLITCVVQRGLAERMVAAAIEVGAQGATISFGRGQGIREQMGVFAVAINVEKEVINIVVSNELAEQVADVMYTEGQLDAPGMGIIYVTALEKVATYVPHDVITVLEEEH